jgi:hypothetical protein
MGLSPESPRVVVTRPSPVTASRHLGAMGCASRGTWAPPPSMAEHAFYLNQAAEPKPEKFHTPRGLTHTEAILEATPGRWYFS